MVGATLAYSWFCVGLWLAQRSVMVGTILGDSILYYIILEKNYHSRLMAFIDSNQILYKSQYGFSKQMSNSLAIIELVEEITNLLDNHEATVGVFIDLKKAFDTVDHSFLVIITVYVAQLINGFVVT